jgi:GT2 family glycosyltransferase
MWALHIKLFGKQIFINRYTEKIPGISKIVKKIEAIMIISQTAHQRSVEYAKWYSTNKPTKKLIDWQNKAEKKIKKRPLISVIVPTYNTNPEHLKECIESVLAQTYTNWQLCLADDASTNSRVVRILDEYARKDKRIVYMVRKKNGHICMASNSALGLAKGEFIALLDHDDILWPNALYEVVSAINKDPKTDFMYTDEDKIDEAGKLHTEPFFKPDWSFEYLRSVNYITHFSTLRKSLIDRIGGFRPGYEGAQDWDLFLRASRETDNILHIPKVLYSWRKSANSTAQRPEAKNYAYVNQKKALEDDIKTRGYEAKVEWEIPYSMWRVQYQVKKSPLVSIVIPTKNQLDFISTCLKSIVEKTTYKNYEIIVVDTGSDDNAVWNLYDSYKDDRRIRVIEWNEKPFNFSRSCNKGAEASKGEYILFLNNDTSVITETWLEDMLGYAQQQKIGAVGAKLYYPDGKIQHAGIIMGVGGQNGTPGIAGHFFPVFADNPPQDPAQSLYVGGTRNFAAVTAACVMVSKKKFKAVNGFDPIFQIAFNDVDFCLKLLSEGWRNVYLPHVKLFHYESVSVGRLGAKQRDPAVFAKEIKLMLKKWNPIIENDPYYHPAFRRDVASARLDV